MINIPDIDIEKQYSFLVQDVISYIEEIQLIKGKQSDISLVDIIVDYSLKKGVNIELIGDAIRSDTYFTSFIEKDCKMRNIIKGGITEMDVW